MPLAKNLIEAAGNATQANYIEDVFSTYLYTGTGAAQTITNNIDLATKGGLVWTKSRSNAVSHALIDSARGKQYLLRSDTTDAQITSGGADYISSFNADGYSVSGGWGLISGSGQNYASWTFRKQPKFFDVVTYTGNGTSQSIAHSLGSVPGCIIIKNLSVTDNWFVYHKDYNGGTNAYQYRTFLNLTNAVTGPSSIFLNAAPTSTNFSVGSGLSTNDSGITYVAYIFAHNAGGFGLTGTDNVISCGSFTTDVNGSATVSLGYEPQWFLVKRSSGAENWFLYDTMRGFANLSDQVLFPNLSNAENNFGPTSTSYFTPTATGVNAVQWFGANSTYIYIAIRRGPMKVPTDATKVFSPNNQTVSGSIPVTTNFPVDMTWDAYQSNAGNNHTVWDRLRGSSQTSCEYLQITKTDAESSAGVGLGYDNNTGYLDKFNSAGYAHIYWNFRRAPGFFDEVCYTGDDVAGRTLTHNLSAIPSLMIVKQRSAVSSWIVYDAFNGPTNATLLNLTNASFAASGYWNNTAPTSTVFSVGANGAVNSTGSTYVAYLFATCAGVSKVGSYTGTGTTQQIDCGFAAGARFVLIKRTDSTGDWYVWDTARGIVSGNDPYLLLNSTAAEVTITDYIDPYSAGFELSTTAAATVNVIGGSYIFLAIA